MLVTKLQIRLIVEAGEQAMRGNLSRRSWRDLMTELKAALDEGTFSLMLTRAQQGIALLWLSATVSVGPDPNMGLRLIQQISWADA